MHRPEDCVMFSCMNTLQCVELQAALCAHWGSGIQKTSTDTLALRLAFLAQKALPLASKLELGILRSGPQN